MKKINAKCLSFKELSYTAEGFIMPCCWIDTPIALLAPQIMRLRQKHLKLENNEKIDDIINSKEWKNFFEELKTDPIKKMAHSFDRAAMPDINFNKINTEQDVVDLVKELGDSKEGKKILKKLKAYLHQHYPLRNPTESALSIRPLMICYVGTTIF